MAHSSRNTVFKLFLRILAALGFLAAAVALFMSTNRLLWEAISDYIGDWFPYTNFGLNVLGLIGLAGLFFLRKWALYLYLASISGEWIIKLASSYFDRLDKFPIPTLSWGPVITVAVFQALFLWILWENRKAYQ